VTLAAPWHIDRPQSPSTESTTALAAKESAHDARHPISRWYLLPLADGAARILARTSIRPWHVTLTGFALAGCCAAALLAAWPSWVAAACALAAWFFDRVDGKLARRQGTATALGAWLDANLDELADVGLHAALAAAAATVVDGSLPWMLFAAFVAGKYLFFHSRDRFGCLSRQPKELSGHDAANGTRAEKVPDTFIRATNLPGNADFRTHLLVVAISANWLIVELAIVAVYYNLRWLMRYGLVLARQSRKGGAA